MSAVVHTADGSCTLYSERCGDHYHSLHGAYTESEWIYIKEGLQKVHTKDPILILEVGWGTGLNSIITCRHATAHHLNIEMHALEPYPPDEETISDWLGYSMQFTKEEKDMLQTMHAKKVYNHKGFKLTVFNETLLNYQTNTLYDLVYYDAFAPSKQAEMWQESAFMQVGKWLKPGGILVTYCAQGSFRRILRQLGFEIEKLKGPPGKREITRAIKTNSFPLSL